MAQVRCSTYARMVSRADWLHVQLLAASFRLVSSQAYENDATCHERQSNKVVGTLNVTRVSRVRQQLGSGELGTEILPLADDVSEMSVAI